MRFAQFGLLALALGSFAFFASADEKERKVLFTCWQPSVATDHNGYAFWIYRDDANGAAGGVKYTVVVEDNYSESESRIVAEDENASVSRSGSEQEVFEANFNWKSSPVKIVYDTQTGAASLIFGTQADTETVECSIPSERR